MTVAQPFVVTADVGPVRWLTMENPARKNAVPPSGWRELAAAFAGFEVSDARVLVVRGAGDDFCSGADLGAGGVAHPPSSPVETARMVRAAGDAALALHRISKPTIAAVDGVAFGAGMNLAIGCDVVVATDRARFAQAFVLRGLTLDTGATWLLPRLVGLARARELALTGREVDATEAAASGLVALVVGVGELMDAVDELAGRLAAGAPLAQRFVKSGLDRASSLTFEQALAFEAQSQAVALLSEDAAEGIAAFLEKRPPTFRGR
jgi:2-(1,2-epoxy-1,2-dihydrophenyl)acetyl-CoA isomerase